MANAKVERRLTAILAADIVGYSRLIEINEADTLATIRDLRSEVINPLIARHEGRIVKLMGDGVIAEFTSVADAVSCAVAVQRRVPRRQANIPTESRIVFRMGVNLGDVVVEGDDLLGDGINVASRLEQLCEPGGVLISGTVYDNLPKGLDLAIHSAGEQHVKNLLRPVRTYKVRVAPPEQPANSKSREKPTPSDVFVKAAAPTIAEGPKPRLCAVVAAAVVDYDRLLALDEASVLASLKALRQGIDLLVDEHDGRVANVRADGFCIEFGSAVEAVACAVAIQKKAGRRQIGAPEDRRVRLRIGVHLGEVLVKDGELNGDGLSWNALVGLGAC